ncbi:M48 family metalloprotease [Saccharothrix luteola]|uniref:M48 family metalloprotease n=1 Tax=Saccharothrix luteola TaxID=2893018 RepID=UPI001E315DE9|nr:M48 family metalloprotease [Saccharothrix luteola]MCC8249711.1 M48 family metalloprotease [Saccharothrix luteola]
MGTALAVIGAGAGQVLSITLDLGDVAPSHACLVRNGISVYGGDPVTLDQAAYGSCMGDYSRVQALAALAGAVALPVTAWLLMLVGGIGTRWRLRPGRIAGAPAASQRLADRFAVLCDSQGLTGRNRPRLVPAPPGTGVTQAFTTGLPGTRPWVVVPLAYAYTDPAAFDAVAVHELGHVRSRDVLWASAVWWAGWLAVPALLLALLPLAGIPAVVWELYGGALVAAVVVALVMFVLRAGLLRRRELAADRHVLEVTADPTALTALIRPSGKRRAGVFATHPTAADRLALDPDAREREGGFVFTAAVGVVAMAAYHVVFTASTSLQWTIDTDTTTWAPVVAALLWASVVVPAWTGRAMSGPSGWTGPLAGAVVGLVVGYFLQPPGVITTIVALSGRGLLLSVPGLVVIAFAVALLTAGMATRLARHNRPRLGGFGAVLAVTAALAAAWGTITSAAVIHVAIGGVESIRWLLVVNGHHGIWRYTAALALVGLALVVPRSHLRGPVPAVIGMAAVTGGTASALSWYSRSGGDLSDPRNGFLTYQAWWVCALAGLVTAVVVAVVNGGALSAAPTSVLCGLLAAASAGAVQYAVLRFGYGVRSDLFRGTLQQPGWLLLLALIGTTPLTALLAAAVRRPQPRRGAVRWATGTAGLTALLALLLVAGGLTSVTVAERDLSDLATPSAAAKTPPVAPANTPRPLDQDAATAALADVPAVLPPGAQNVPTLPDSSSTRTPATCDEAVKRATVNEKALPRTAEVEQRFTFPMGDIPNGAGIRVAVTSYSAAHPGFADLDAENQACANFRQRSTEGNGYLDCYITPRPASDFPLARKRTLTALGQVKGTALVVTIHHYAAIFGSTRIDVAVDWFYLATAPPQAVLDETDRLVTSAMNVIAVKL